jgi:peroxiredoxin
MRTIVRSSLTAVAVLILLGTAPQQGGLYLPAGSTAPTFSVQGIDGNTYGLESLTAEGPVFLVFWKDPCPHNRRAMPHFNALKTAYGEKVTLLGAVRSSVDGTRAWGTQFSASFPLLPDPDSKLIDAFDTSYSIATFEIGRDGRITRVFEGYGQNELTSLNQAMASAAGVAPAQLDLSSAPQRQTWG